MLTSISPLGERARRNHWPMTVAWITLGAACGGAALGAGLGALGELLGSTGAVEQPQRIAVLAAAAAAAAVWDLTGRRLPGRRQVNEDWLAGFRSWVYGLGFGLQLGAAFATVVNTALVPLFALAALLSSDTVAGLAIGAAFGIMRGLSVTASRGVRTPDDLRRLHRLLDALDARVRRWCAAAAAVLSAAAVVALLTPAAYSASVRIRALP